ncbi:MAG: hypothetical protein M1833_001591 [Piccolia ochrophora]|nr:MAG: hypothetical protein M1833_001591 [Piccolia ochrophora]
MAMDLRNHQGPNSASFLSLHQNDDDASSLRSASQQDTDSDDDQVLHGAQDSLEISKHDRLVLDEEEEREKLLARDGPNGGLRRIFSAGSREGPRIKIGKKECRRRRKAKKASTGGKRRASNEKLLSGEGQMYEMEEGGLKSDSSSVFSDSSADLDRRNFQSLEGRKSWSSRNGRTVMVASSLIVLFLILSLGAYSASRHFRSAKAALLLFNGTSLFLPTTILISLDGFRADFLRRGLTPTLNSFVADGVSPKYMKPSFPSLTFPNHFTLATGLHPESHGIVGNTFWDPNMGAEFYYTDPDRSMQPKWWLAEPLWVTAERQGALSAIHMWPGSEAHLGGLEPTHLDPYNGTEELSKKVDRMLELLDMAGPDDPPSPRGNLRPQLIAAYVPVVDSDGHKYGPNSSEIMTTIQHVDDMLHDVFAGLEERNLTNIVNVVIVSDHGMATTSTDRLIQLDDIIDMDLIEHTDGWPLYGLRPKDPSHVEELYNRLRQEADNSPGYDVYLRDENMPSRYHFTNNPRIAPLWMVPRPGWAIVTREDFDVKKAKESDVIYHPRGLHGYDNDHPLMRAIFVARGPAFPLESNSRLEVFQNIEVYNIVCDSLNIVPEPNNGTLRLPLKPLGLHSDPDAEPDDIPSDPPIEEVDSGDDLQSETPVVDPPANKDVHDEDEDEESSGNLQEFRKHFIKFVHDLKSWVHGIFDSGTSDDDSHH